jgi:hypothetical protein
MQISSLSRPTSSINLSIGTLLLQGVNPPNSPCPRLTDMIYASCECGLKGLHYLQKFVKLFPRGNVNSTSSRRGHKTSIYMYMNVSKTIYLLPIAGSLHESSPWSFYDNSEDHVYPPWRSLHVPQRLAQV